jgi:general secretion pathway protein B
MSFILDALRKSDAERQRQGAPGLADIRYARRPVQRSTWVPILVVVLAANLLGMAWLWFRSGPPSSPTAPVAAVPAAAPAAPLPVAVPPPAEPGPPPLPPEVRPLAEEAGTMAPAAGGDNDPGGDPEPAGALLPGGGVPDPLLAAAAELPPSAPPAPPPAGTSRILDDPGLPTSQQLIAAGTLRVPELSLELHVYSSDPARRFVIINGGRYREGASLKEGPRVEAINAEGVVLDSQGTRFVLLPK